MPSRDDKRRQKQLAKKAAKRKTKRAERRQAPARHPSDSVQLFSYEITDEPIPERGYERLPDPVKDDIERLHHDVLLHQPSEAVARLTTLIAQYPDVPQLYNFLHVAYQQLNDRANAQRVLQQTLARFPDYLFARIAYANDCLQRGETEQVPAIFNHQYDLKSLYPKRHRFHISEVLGFCATMAWYFHDQGEVEQAKTYYQLMRQLDPGHRNTRFVKRLLSPSPLDTFLRRLVDRDR